MFALVQIQAGRFDDYPLRIKPLNGDVKRRHNIAAVDQVQRIARGLLTFDGRIALQELRDQHIVEVIGGGQWNPCCQ